MTNSAIASWVALHSGIFQRLEDALLTATTAAGDVARAIDAGQSVETIDEGLDRAASLASLFLRVIDEAMTLPDIPDVEAARHFRAALQRWRDAVETEVLAAQAKDGTQFQRAARAFEAGGNEMLQSAAALRRATGQLPDPRNPFS